MKYWLSALFLAGLGNSVSAQQAPTPPAAQPTALDANINRTRQLTADNINEKTEILRDPSLAVDNAKQVLGEAVETQAKELSGKLTPARGLTAPGQISDPTQMTGSFSQALNRINGKSGANGAPSTPPVLPQISLAAKAIRHNNQKASMLNVAGKVLMIKEGGRFSFVVNNVVNEILVNKIEKDRVEITLLPLGRQLILE